MKNKLLYLLLCFPAFGFSQVNEEAKKHPQYIGQQIGTLGYGLHYSYGISPQWALRANASYFHINQRTEETSSTLISERHRFLRTGGFGIVADWSFAKNNPNWKLSFGAYYQFNLARETRDYTYMSGDVIEDLGRLKIEFTTMPVNPYLGFMFGNFKSDKVITYAIEAGTLFHGHPKVDFTGSGRIEQTAEQDDLIRDNVKNYMFYPVINFKLNYKLK